MRRRSQAYRAALARNPRHEASRLRVIQLLTQRASSSRRSRSTARSCALSPREPRFVVELGKLLIQAGRREEALALLVQTGRAQSRATRASTARCSSSTRAGTRRSARRTSSRCSTVSSPTIRRTSWRSASSCSTQGDTDKALAVVEADAAERPDKARAHAALGAVLLDHDMPERALAEYEAALQLAPDELEFVRGAAETLERLQRSGEAAQRWQQVLVARDRALAAARGAPARRAAVGCERRAAAQDRGVRARVRSGRGARQARRRSGPLPGRVLPRRRARAEPGARRSAQARRRRSRARARDRDRARRRREPALARAAARDARRLERRDRRARQAARGRSEECAELPGADERARARRVSRRRRGRLRRAALRAEPERRARPRAARRPVPRAPERRGRDRELRARGGARRPARSP